MTYDQLLSEIQALPAEERWRPAVAQTPDGKLLQVTAVKEVKDDPRLNAIAIILTGDA